MVSSLNERPPLITEVPLTAEAREQLIGNLFIDELPYSGEVFIPDDSFYHGTPGRKKAEHMVRVLCRWLGIKPGYIGLEFESGDNKPADGKRYTIYIESSTLSDEFVLGGYLAYVLTGYLIEEQKQIHLGNADQQATILASASIVFGLGLVIMNGINPSYTWTSHFLNRTPHFLKSFPLHNYSHMTQNFLRKYRIEQNTYAHSLTPWASRRLGLSGIKQATHAVRDAKHQALIATSKQLGFVWVCMLVIGVGGFVLTQRTKPDTPQLRTAEENASFFYKLTHICEDELAYDKQFSDFSDIQTVRVLNAEALRCQSLHNRHAAAEQEYQRLRKQ